MAADPVRKPDNTAITVSPPAVQRIGSWVCAPVLGAVIGWLLRLASTWVASLSWAPFQGVFKLLASGSDPWGTIAVVAGGAAIGLGFAGLWAQERVSVVVDTDAVTLLQGHRKVELDRNGIGAVFLDEQDLVVLDESGGERHRVRVGLPLAELRRAFGEHEYPWSDGDPHRNSYRLWEGESPDLPLRVNELLAARQRAIRRRDRRQQQALREELGRHGIVLRDRNKRQHWRAVTRD